MKKIKENILFRKQNIYDLDMQKVGQEFLYNKSEKLGQLIQKKGKEIIDNFLFDSFVKELKDGQYNSINLYEESLIYLQDKIKALVRNTKYDILIELLEEDKKKSTIEKSKKIINERSQVIKDIKEIGGQNINFALDDYPNGLNGLYFILKDKNINTIKIDVVFFQNIFEKYKKQNKLDVLAYKFDKFVRIIKKYGKNKIIVEGIEKKEHYDFFQKHGKKIENKHGIKILLQGYFLHKPTIDS